jgi:hypothetical protein
MDAAEIAREAAGRASRETASRVADALAERPNIVRIGPRGSEEILDLGEKQRTRKSPRDR